MNAAEQLFEMTRQPIDAEYAELAMRVAREYRDFRVALDLHIKKLAPRLIGHADTSVRTLDNLTFTADMLAEAVSRCIQYEGISPRAHWRKSENARLQRVGESVADWCKRTYFNVIRDAERDPDSMHSSLNASLSEDDPESQTIVTALPSGDYKPDDPGPSAQEKYAELYGLRERGARLIVERIRNEAAQDALCLLLDKRLSQEEIAERLSVPRSTVGRWLRNALRHAPLREIVRAILQELNTLEGRTFGWFDESSVTIKNRSKPEVSEQSRKLARLDRQYRSRIADGRREAARTMPAKPGYLASGEEAPVSVHTNYFDGIATLPWPPDKSDALLDRKLEIAKAHQLGTGSDAWREALQPESARAAQSAVTVRCAPMVDDQPGPRCERLAVDPIHMYIA